MYIWQQEGEAFSNFRFALETKIGSLQDTADPAVANKRAEDAVREITEVQLHEVEVKMKSVREKLGLALIGSVASLVAAVQNQGFGLLTAVASVTPLASAYLDYRHDIKRHPAFFLWKALPKNGRR